MKNSNKEQKKKTVLITGGSGGIGKAVAAAFLGRGEKVYITGRNKTALDAAAEELSGISEDIHTLRGDLSDISACEKIISDLISEAGSLDILINCAGIYFEKLIGDVEPEDWEKMINTNLRAPFFMTKYAMPYLSLSKGSVVNVGSTAGITGFDADSVYCAAKGGMTLMTKALAVECAKKGVRVNIVSPDMVKTGMLDVGFNRSGMEDRSEYDKKMLSSYPQSSDDVRFIVPEDVAKAVIFLAYREYSETITGANLVIDCGLTAGIY